MLKWMCPLAALRPRTTPTWASTSSAFHCRVPLAMELVNKPGHSCLSPAGAKAIWATQWSSKGAKGWPGLSIAQ